MTPSDIRPLRELEKEAIIKALIMTYNVKRAALLLEITDRTIYNKMRSYGISLAWIKQQRRIEFDR